MKMFAALAVINVSSVSGWSIKDVGPQLGAKNVTSLTGGSN